MSEINKEAAETAILDALKNSMEDARETARSLADSFRSNVRTLRVEETEEVFLSLVQNINDLQHFMEFIGGLNKCLGYLEGLNIHTDPITTDNTGLDLFYEMSSSLEAKDWVMLSDIIEYELAPLLLKEDKWLVALNEELMHHAV